MKKSSIIFLQAVVVLVGLGALAFMLVMPHFEGRNVDATVFEVYFKDPFLAYAYIASILFFTALYKAFKLLGYIGRNEVFSFNSVQALRTIKYCAVTLSALIVMAGAYIRAFHAGNDDPAGFLALCIVTTFVSIVIATGAAVFEKLLQKAIDIKSENDLTV